MKEISSYLDSHFNESFTIHEAGIKLTPEHYLKIRRRLESLELKSPSSSFIKLSFSAEEKQISGTLAIYGGGKNFKATVKGQNPWEITKKLEKKVLTQLKLWKKSRFLDEFIETSLKERNQKLTGGYAV